MAVVFGSRGMTRRLEDHYTVTGMLREGGNAKVFSGVNKHTNEKVAMKWISKENGGGVEADLRHAEILHLVDHQHIISLKDYFDTPNELMLIMELANGGDVVDRIDDQKYFSEKLAVRYCRQILSALVHCHKRGIVHCDLKPENILFSSPHDDAVIKIADFGFAQLMAHDEKLWAERGTPEYIAPEIWAGQGYDTAADLWSFGVLVYIILSGVFPFYGETREDLIRKIMRGEYRFFEAQFRHVSEEAKTFIRALLVVDPKRRLSAEQCLAHPWIMNDNAPTDSLDEATTQIKELNKRRALVNVSHCLSSVIIHSDRDDPNRDMPLGASSVAEDETLGRGMQAVLSLAYEEDIARNLSAASTIMNYCLNEVYRSRLVDAGVLRAIVVLAGKPHIQVQNFAALTLFHIAQTPALLEGVFENIDVVPTVVKLGGHTSKVIVRQAGRVMASLFRSEKHRVELVRQGGLTLLGKLLESTMIEHQREALKSIETLAESPAMHVSLCTPLPHGFSILTHICNLARASDSVGVQFLCAMIIMLLSTSSSKSVLTSVVQNAAVVLGALLHDQVVVIKTHSCTALKNLFLKAREELMQVQDPAVQTFLALATAEETAPSQVDSMVISGPSLSDLPEAGLQREPSDSMSITDDFFTPTSPAPPRRESRESSPAKRHRQD